MAARYVLPFLLVLFFSFQAVASTTLCTISSDIDSNIAVLSYDMDEDQRSVTHMYQETYENGKLTSKEEINMDGLNNGGIILLKKDKLVVVRIWSDNFDRERGGVLYVDTLYSGISGERRQYEMDVSKNNQGNIILLSNKNEFNKMKFIAKRSKVFGVIGIEKIVFSK